MDAVNGPLEVLPKHLNQTEVKPLTGALKNAHFPLLKPFCVHLIHCFGSLSGCLAKTSAELQLVDKLATC